ncbi:helix-turn-helix domain-containing protein [Pseudoxanthomonas koreensis]|uniref:helix-turn-helix domain-containing protein n=1 Tax=Pseudoxanthomonas koreensis TaxID=266061 RepID=UPI00139085F4|nr:helix-turn-helix domain-containing protein [Pseudoxanthomonas koreensis]KAF1695314.1 XRE family transcriptional regulator [Pseudoxanthomonas koreensis]
MPAIDITADAKELGRALRARRKALGISMVAAAEAAGISRITWHRLEKGEPTVALGSLLAAARVLGIGLYTTDAGTTPAQAQAPEASLPLRIRPADHPQLGRLAWQMDADATTLAPREAFGLYQRNWRHVDVAALQPGELSLIHALRETFGGDWPGV